MILAVIWASRISAVLLPSCAMSDTQKYAFCFLNLNIFSPNTVIMRPSRSSRRRPPIFRAAPILASRKPMSLSFDAASLNMASVWS
uniref:Putative secreted protein midgut overexpressed n=1 Tax=Rhipicephalus microplus TaxID=6941 RepID=A0A6M2DAJ0_RHIMP